MWELDVGTLMNQSILTIDLLQFFMGLEESVYAFYETTGHDRIKLQFSAK